jgi:hypothetical protein
MASVKGQLTGAASSLSSFAGLAAGAFSVAAVGAIAFGKALEFGDIGAQIGQTRDSFESLATSLGQGPELLNELQVATRGTVTELDLMRSTSTLLMGTSGELGEQLAANAPQLAAIAQAAHDLNPTMGTTAEMYDRLSRGIKKAEPELLDEVGILMNLTQVYKEYAKSHGITVTAMDKTMKTEAMLNAVLKQGNVLVEQAAQVNTSAATSIDRMQASMENAGNAAKEALAPGIANAVDAVYLLTTGTKSINTALVSHSQEVQKVSGSYQEYVSELYRAAEASGRIVDVNGNLRDATYQLIQANYVLSAGEWAVSKSMLGVNNASMYLSGGLSTLDAKASGFGMSVGTIEGGLSMLGETFPEVTEAVGMSADQLDVYGQRMSGLAGYYAELEAAEQNRITTAGLMAGIQGTLGQATESYSQTLAQLTTQETLITDALVDAQERGYAPTSEKITELNAALTANQEAQAGALTALQTTTAEMLYQQAAAGLDAQSALDLARDMGVLSEADYVVSTSMQALREEFFNANTGMLEAGASASEFVSQAGAITKAVQNLQAKNIPVTFDSIAKELESMAQANASTEIAGVGTAADDAAPGMEDVASAAADVASGMEDASPASQDEATALADINAAAGPAAKGISSAASAASSAVTPLRNAAQAAGQLASELSNIDGRTTISVSVSGVDSAIARLQELTGVINAIPTNVTINVSLSESSAPVSYSTYVPEFGETTYPGAPATEIYNIYDPLAAAILIETKRSQTVNKLEAILNG